MNIYLISQKENVGWDTFDSAVVCAESEEEAREICPVRERTTGRYNEEDNEVAWGFEEWASLPEYVECEFLGVAKEGLEKGVICASFNAG